ncbi:RICIN domain-containing protein [Microbispora hainanensis]|uniref:RICIN domain-containing protein n=2 Tax=Microbispora hainanensis TaxID=568844 RepID=A0A544YQA7_9ACTN|nr:RICIN domain-containing protein [Microbispora hainanensis]
MSAATVADRVVGGLYSMTGANTVRLPINEPTVSGYWGTYTGAIDTALGKGNVIFAYWASSGGRPPNMTALLAVHDYTMFLGTPYDSENEWAAHVGSYIGNHADRTVVTEWGGPMGPGSKYGVQWDPIDYSVPSGSLFADYIRGVSAELRGLGVGSVYWPGLRDGDWYSLTSRNGSGAGIGLSLVNPSGLTRLQYAWGVGDGGGTYVRIRNASTGRYVDGMGRTSDGAALGQYGDSNSANQQWKILSTG